MKEEAPSCEPLADADRGDSRDHRLQVLDGWRGISILLVLGCHMLPLGPKAWRLNECAGLMGMSIFFTLSGFLITRSLLKSPRASTFLIRRFARIIPLAWLATVLYLTMQGSSAEHYLNTLLFTVNYEMEYLTPLTSPFWSLCVEVHFYLTVALLVMILGARGLLVLPVLGLVITAIRIRQGATAGIETHLRVDEILAGAALALIWSGALGGRLGSWISWVLMRCPLMLVAVAFFASSHSAGGYLMYIRPYLGAATVGVTLYSLGRTHPILSSRSLRYIAEISYALYVIHPVTRFGWLSSGDYIERNLKRPICFALTFVLAHLSTFHFERPCIALGKRISRWWERATVPPIEARPVHLVLEQEGNQQPRALE